MLYVGPGRCVEQFVQVGQRVVGEVGSLETCVLALNRAVADPSGDRLGLSSWSGAADDDGNSSHAGRSFELALLVFVASAGRWLWMVAARRLGSDLSVHTEADLDAVAAELNDRPRKRLKFCKPIEEIGPLRARR